MSKWGRETKELADILANMAFTDMMESACQLVNKINDYIDPTEDMPPHALALILSQWGNDFIERQEKIEQAKAKLDGSGK